MLCRRKWKRPFIYRIYITVSNIDNANILCKYLMYILTDYRLILTKDWQKTDPNSRQRGQTLAGLRWPGPAATVNYRPILSSERALQNNKQQLSKRKSQGERNWSRVPDERLTQRRTGRLIVGRKTLTVTRPPLLSSGQSSWLHKGDVLWFLCGKN
jgi:hypothetical protein